jgi:hypothetical protein
MNAKLLRSISTILFISLAVVVASSIITWQQLDNNKRQTILDLLTRLRSEIAESAPIKGSTPTPPRYEKITSTEHKANEAPNSHIRKRNIHQTNKYTYLSSCQNTAKTRLKKTQLYQWEDSAGRRHFSDQPPLADYHNLHIKSLDATTLFKLEMDTQFAKLPPFVSDRIQGDINQIYRIFTKEIGVAALHPIQLNLKFFDDKSQFNHYKESVAPHLGSAGGFYTSINNEAVVYTAKNDQRMYSVTRHEAVHAMVNGAFGRTPVWINEGLAEYFERLKLENGYTRTVEVSSDFLNQLRNSQLPDLNDYLNFPPSIWYEEEKKGLHYAIAWSLIYFLAATDDRRTFLRHLLDKLSVDYCRSLDSVAYFNQHYSGGVGKLERSWRRWLKIKPEPHRY